MIYLFIFIQVAYSMEMEYLQYSYFTTNDFNDAQGWSSSKGNVFSNCGGYRLFGGYNLFSKTTVSKQITDLYSHKKLRISALFLKIDSWDNEYFKMRVDGAEVFAKTFWISDGGSNICGWNEYLISFGASTYEQAYRIDVTVPHTSSTALVEFQDYLSSAPNDESWGIREIYIYVIFDCPEICDNTCEFVNL